jgi:hypothetical protein
MKHTIEEKESLQELLEHPALALLLKELSLLAEAQGTSVLKYDLSTGTDSELVKMKCRHEGAHRLYMSFKRHLETLKTPAKR